ncbi:MAG: proline dehydrogenase family protein [Candidatus Micrarchaeales archaeon]
MSFLGRIGIIFAMQWMGGISEGDELRIATKINAQHKGAILNYLGENYDEKKDVEKSVQIYFKLLREMKSRKIRGSISVKPSQLGILISDQEFYANYLRIAQCAKKLGFLVWVDAEEYEYIERTHRVMLRVLKKCKNTGIGIQTRLKRSMGDAKRIAKAGGLIRLVKGAYAEPEDRAYTDREGIQKNYENIMEELFRLDARLMIATHDDYLIYKAVSLEKKYRRKVMFGMLKGIRGKLADKLVVEGEDVHIYVPFGEEWFAYSMRRLQEKGHAMLLIRSMFQQ